MGGLLHDDQIDRTDDQLDDELAHEPGTTVALGPNGWEDVPYVAPGDDWHLAEDGSWVSPDGQLRSWLLSGPEPEPY